MKCCDQNTNVGFNLPHKVVRLINPILTAILAFIFKTETDDGQNVELKSIKNKESTHWNLNENIINIVTNLKGLFELQLSGS